MPGSQRTGRRGRARDGPRQPRLFVHIQPQPVPGAVPERLAKARLLQHRAGRAIDGRRLDTRPDGRDGCLLRGQNGGVKTANLLARRPNRHRPREVGAVSVQNAAEVQHHQVARLEPAIAGAVVRQRGVGPGRDDCFKRGPLVAGRAAARLRWPPPRRVPRRPDAPRRRPPGPPASVPPPPGADSLQLELVLHRAQVLDQPLGGPEPLGRFAEPAPPGVDAWPR